MPDDNIPATDCTQASTYGSQLVSDQSLSFSSGTPTLPSTVSSSTQVTDDMSTGASNVSCSTVSVVTPRLSCCKLRMILHHNLRAALNHVTIWNFNIQKIKNCRGCYPAR